MRKDQAIELLKRHIAASSGLERARSSPEFNKWHRNTEVLIERIFGEQTRHINDFRKVRYILPIVVSGTPDSEHQASYARGLQRARAVLESFVDEVATYWPDEEPVAPLPAPAALEIIDRVCSRFHLVARQIRFRHSDRQTLEVEDEYDVQDLLHALLTVHFDDIRREEWTPSYAGGSSRVDFLLKTEQVIVEVKKTRKGLDARRLGEELLIDIQRYQAHPDCCVLFCLVYDPEGRITNPKGLECDLAKSTTAIQVQVAIVPRGH